MINWILAGIMAICAIVSIVNNVRAKRYLAETKCIIARNNEIMRKTMKPINRDGSINELYFTNKLIEVIDETER
jgi:hypothetical protein